MTLPACLLRVAVEVEPDIEAEWNRWYDEVHLPEIVNCPGFRHAARYVASADGRRFYLALYDLEGPEALDSAQFAERRGWDRFRAQLRWTTRLGRRVADARNAASSLSDRLLPLCLLTVEAEVAPDVEEEWNRWYDGEHLPQVTACPGFVQSARYLTEADGARRYLALYEIMGPEALRTPQFGLASPWGRFEAQVKARAFVHRRIAAREHGGSAML
jgi:antibiotic biosynthesis monooxygenase (ABM) superfamily enzyme